MRKFIKTLLLNISLITACFAAEQSEVVQLDESSSSRIHGHDTALSLRDLDTRYRFVFQPGPGFGSYLRFAEDSSFQITFDYNFTTSAAAAGAGGDGDHRRLKKVLDELAHLKTDYSELIGISLPKSCRHADSSCKCPLSQKLENFQEYFRNRTGKDITILTSAHFVQECFYGSDLNLSNTVAKYCDDSSLEYHTKTDARKPLRYALDNYCKYVFKTVKKHLDKRVIEDEKKAIDEISSALGVLFLHHCGLSPSQNVSRLLTIHRNGLAEEYGLRQELELNHDWGIGTRLVRYIDDSYDDMPLLLQVRLNPNNLPRDVAKQFRRYFRKLSMEARRQLLSD